VRILLVLVTAVVGATAAGAAPKSSVVARIKVEPGVAPCAAAAAGGSVWVSEYGSPYVLRIDPTTNRVLSKTQIGFGSCGLGAGAGSLWIEDTSSSTISRVSVRTRRRTAIRVDQQPYDATFASGAAWATAYTGGFVDRIDPARNRVVKRFKLPTATGVVGAFDAIWATGSDGVIRIDPATNTVIARIALPSAGWTAASADGVWITSPAGLSRIDPTTDRIVATVKIPAQALGDPAVVAGRVWVPEIRENAIAIIDPATNQIASTVKVGLGPFVVTEIAGEAWIPSWKGADIWRLRP
jgi:YVTN family beta-propeller protein